MHVYESEQMTGEQLSVSNSPSEHLSSEHLSGYLMQVMKLAQHESCDVVVRAVAKFVQKI